jgi:hypothetical protein
MTTFDRYQWLNLIHVLQTNDYLILPKLVLKYAAGQLPVHNMSFRTRYGCVV